MTLHEKWVFVALNAMLNLEAPSRSPSLEATVDRLSLLEGVQKSLKELKEDGYCVGLIFDPSKSFQNMATVQAFVQRWQLPIDRVEPVQPDQDISNVLNVIALPLHGFISDEAQHVQGVLDLSAPAVMLARSWNVESLPDVPHLRHWNDFTHEVRNHAQRLALEEALAEIYAKRGLSPLSLSERPAHREKTP